MRIESVPATGVNYGDAIEIAAHQGTVTSTLHDGQIILDCVTCSEEHAVPVTRGLITVRR